MDCGHRERVQLRNILGSCYEDQEGGSLLCGRHGADGVSAVLQFHVLFLLTHCTHVTVCYCFREKERKGKACLLQS